jgi:integrase
MLPLPNGCSCSELKVFPKNWQSSKANVSLIWYIHYRFYDPRFAKDLKIKGKKQKVIKGMNQFSTLRARQDATRALLNQEKMLLEQEMYNPITESTQALLNDEVGMIKPATTLIDALVAVQGLLKKEKSTMRDIGTTVRGVTKSLLALNLSDEPISKIGSKHIKAILHQCSKTNPNWSANRFNSYRSYLMIIFNELVELQAISVNPVLVLKKQKTVRRIRETLNKEERKLISEHLHQNHYSFWRFMQIFFHSGARVSELMFVKKKDVNLINQKFRVIIKKGKSFKETERTIKSIALPFWKEICDSAGYEHYLFSEHLEPGTFSINPNQICRRWNRLVKKKLGVSADFYSLKHSNLDETAALLGAAYAQKMAAHASVDVTMNHYLGGESERLHTQLKSVTNAL